MAETLKFQKLMKKLTGQASSSGELSGAISLKMESDDTVRVTKQSLATTDGFEFSMLVRIKAVGSKTEWLPIEFIGRDGEEIKCETVINGKTLVNMTKQEALYELAETWAKSLEAQNVVNTVENALLR